MELIFVPSHAQDIRGAIDAGDAAIAKARDSMNLWIRLWFQFSFYDIQFSFCVNFIPYLVCTTGFRRSFELMCDHLRTQDGVHAKPLVGDAVDAKASDLVNLATGYWFQTCWCQLQFVCFVNCAWFVHHLVVVVCDCLHAQEALHGVDGKSLGPVSLALTPIFCVVLVCDEHYFYFCELRLNVNVHLWSLIAGRGCRWCGRYWWNHECEGTWRGEFATRKLVSVLLMRTPICVFLWIVHMVCASLRCVDHWSKSR